MSNTWIILVFLFSLALLLFGIIKGKIEGGAMMLIVSLITGVLLKMDASTLISTVASGFGNMMLGVSAEGVEETEISEENMKQDE